MAWKETEYGLKWNNHATTGGGGAAPPNPQGYDGEGCVAECSPTVGGAKLGHADDLYAALFDAFGPELREALQKRPADTFAEVAGDVLREKSRELFRQKNLRPFYEASLGLVRRQRDLANETLNNLCVALADAAPGMWFQAEKELGDVGIGPIAKHVFDKVREKAAAEAVNKARIKGLQVAFDRHEDYADLTVRLWKNPPAAEASDEQSDAA